MIMSTLCFVIYSFAMAAAGGLAGAAMICLFARLAHPKRSKDD